MQNSLKRRIVSAKRFRAIGALSVPVALFVLAKCSSDTSTTPMTSSATNGMVNPPPATGGMGVTTTGGQPTTPPPAVGGSTPVATAGAGAGGQANTAGDTSMPQAGASMGGGAGAAAGGAGGMGMMGPQEPPPLGSWPPPALTTTKIADASQPTAIAAIPGDPSRLFFAEISGRIRVIKDGQLVGEPALDINEKVLVGDPVDGNERSPTQGKRGMIGLAFHPTDATRAFVMYAADQGQQGRYGESGNINNDGDTYFEEYRLEPGSDVFNPEPVQRFLEIDKGNCGACYQHNGGSLEIGVDGFLYASTGDPPPYDGDSNDSQDPESPMGKILRFDISGETVQPAGGYPDGHPAVWDIGIRNTFKFSFDRITGDMYVGDVGERTWEEISVKKYGDLHKNFGWPMREGTHRFQADSCGQDNCIEPLLDYDRDLGNCVIGGAVYRGSAIADLQGTYLYSDYTSRRVFALQAEGGELVNGPMELPDLRFRAACYGQGLDGELYVCEYADGAILRIDAD